MTPYAKFVLLCVAIGLGCDLADWTPFTGAGTLIALFVGFKSREHVEAMSEASSKSRQARGFWRRGRPPQGVVMPAYSGSGLGQGARFSLPPVSLVIVAVLFGLSFWLYRSEWLGMLHQALRPSEWEVQHWAIAAALGLGLLAVILSRFTAYEVGGAFLIYRTPWSYWHVPLKEVQWIYPSVESREIQVDFVAADSRRERIVLWTRQSRAELGFSPALWDALLAACPDAVVGYSEELARAWNTLSEDDWRKQAEC